MALEGQTFISVSTDNIIKVDLITNRSVGIFGVPSNATC
jgi:hypothetical protein